jgi:hypothetical protein
MSTRCERPPSQLLRVYVFAFALMLAAPFASYDAAAETPHENYDLIGSDIDLVIAMLNASIRASEDTLRSFHDQDLEMAQGYLDMATNVVEPAEAILDEIEEVAASYEPLSVLIPPFSALHDEMQGFADLEGTMLSIKEEIVAIAAEMNISDSEAIAAIESIRQMNSVLSEMNDTIDAMLVYADEISWLTVADGYPFVPNELADLTERLRDLTRSVHEEIAELIEEGIPWQDDRSLLLLWIADADLHLGERLSGGGYLLRNGSFIADNVIDVSISSSTVSTVHTNSEGAFSFSYSIPINASWVGVHDVLATAQVSEETIVSDTLVITVSLVPTTIELRLSNTTVSPLEELIVEAVVRQERSQPLPGAECNLSVDGSVQGFITDEDGRGKWIWIGSELGIGTHVFSASFPGFLPYAPCGSGEVTVVVDVPTAVTLNLFEDRLRTGWHLTGDGMLFANVSSPVTDQKISLSIDGVGVTNVKTDATGRFAFSIETEGLEAGTHILSAQFTDRDPYWRSSEDQATFFIISLSYSDYPFFPWIPGWDIGGGLTEQIPYLFFGEYAYYTWLFIVLVIGVVIKALQARKRKSPSEGSSEGVAAEGELSVFDMSREKAIASREQMPDWLASPNDKIIWHYHNLLVFLKTRGRIGITDNMTHWEVANLLGLLGYPQGEAGKIAQLYEKAQYSGSDSSEDEVLQMDSSSIRLRLSGGVRSAV